MKRSMTVKTLVGAAALALALGGCGKDSKKASETAQAEAKVESRGGAVIDRGERPQLPVRKRLRAKGEERMFGDERPRLGGAPDPAALEERMKRREARRAARIAEYDTDGDGELDDAERDAMRETMMKEREERRAARIAEYDADGDGELDDAERLTMHETMKRERVANLVAVVDGDGDGVVSREEAEMAPRRGGRALRDFDRADADGDGFLTEDELASAMPERGRRGWRGPRRGMRGGGPPAGTEQ